MKWSVKLITLLAALVLADTVVAEPVINAVPAARPGVIRLGSVCFKGDDLPDYQVPCDDRAADAEKMAGLEWILRSNLTRNWIPITSKADWEAWQAIKGSYSSSNDLENAFHQELKKQAKQHADRVK